MVHDRLKTSFIQNPTQCYDCETGNMHFKRDDEAFPNIRSSIVSTKSGMKKNYVSKPKMDASLNPKRQYDHTISCGLEDAETWHDVDGDRYPLSGPYQKDLYSKPKMDDTKRQYDHKASSGLEDAETWADVKRDRYSLPGSRDDAFRGKALKTCFDILKLLLDPDQCDAFKAAVTRSRKTSVDGLMSKRFYDRDTRKKPYVKERSHPEYRVLNYVVPRKDYGRLDYNANIAQRIYKGLQNTDLSVPDIIKRDHVSFMALVPKSEESDEFGGGEVMDITEGKEWKRQSKEIRRWVILFPENDLPIEIPKQDEMLHITETKGGNLKENSDVQRFITFSFENEIFAYAERAFRYVKFRLTEKMEQQQEMLRMVNLEIRSLLARKLPEHNASTFSTPEEQSIDNDELQFPSSRKIKKALETKSLQNCGIRGFCNTAGGIRVFVRQPKEDSDRIDTANRIEAGLSEYIADKPVITWVESIQISDLVARGDKLITNRQADNWGTLGCFGKGLGERLVAITAGHCAKAGQTIQIEDHGNMVEFGICAESHNDADIAIIDINEDMDSRCEKAFLNENLELCKVSVYQEDELPTLPVHKIGAATQLTSGVVYCGGAHICDEEGIIINGNTDSPVFAIPGDSGSIVFFYDPADIHNKTVKLLSIVSKQIQIKESGAIPPDVSRTPILTRSLKDGLEKVHNVPDITISE